MGNLHLQLSNGFTTEHFAFIGNRVEATASLTGYAGRLSLLSCNAGASSNCSGAYARFAIENSDVWSLGAGYVTQTSLLSRLQAYGFLGLRVNSLVIGRDDRATFTPWPSVEAGGGLSFSLHKYISLYAEGGVTATLPYGVFGGAGLRLNI